MTTLLTRLWEHYDEQLANLTTSVGAYKDTGVFFGVDHPKIELFKRPPAIPYSAIVCRYNNLIRQFNKLHPFRTEKLHEMDALLKHMEEVLYLSVPDRNKYGVSNNFFKQFDRLALICKEVELGFDDDEATMEYTAYQYIKNRLPHFKTYQRMFPKKRYKHNVPSESVLVVAKLNNAVAGMNALHKEKNYDSKNYLALLETIKDYDTRVGGLEEML